MHRKLETYFGNLTIPLFTICSYVLKSIIMMLNLVVIGNNIFIVKNKLSQKEMLFAFHLPLEEIYA